MIVCVVDGSVRTHKGRPKTMYPRASFATKREVDNVQLILDISFLSEGTVHSRVTDEPFFIIGIRSMMVDRIIFEEKLKMDGVELLVLPLVQMHGIFGAS